MKKNNLFFKLFYVFCLLTVFFGTFNFACQEHSKNKKDADDLLIMKFEQDILRLMNSGSIPGLSIALIKEGKIIWYGTYGVKNLQTNEPVDGNTVFEAASLTKPLFAYCALRMMDEGLFELDTPLITYLPEEEIKTWLLRHALDYKGFRQDWFKKITARHVLSHSAGMPHGERGKPYPLFFAPGERYRYSAAGYWFLQLVVEHLKGEKLENIIKTYVLDPLGMTRSHMVWQERYETQAAAGHGALGDTTGKPRKRNRAHAAASLYTTAEDYARFVIAVMNGTGLKPETAETMLTPQINCEEDIYWSLGFGIQRFPSADAFWQWGDYGIFRNYIMAFPEKKMGMVYLTNSFNGLSIGKEVVTRTLDVEDKAIRFLGYDQYDDPIVVFIQSILVEGLDKGLELYSKYRTECSEDTFGERHINRAGYILASAKRYDEAVAVLKLNVESYPFSANAYDSLAEAYQNAGNIEMAVSTYEKVLEIIPRDPRPDKEFLEQLKENAINKLKKLKSKKK